jgi:hypothetical protein
MKSALAAAQGVEPRLVLRDDPEDERVQVWRRLMGHEVRGVDVPVVAGERDVIAPHPFLEPVRPGAHGVRPEVRAVLFHGRRRDDAEHDIVQIVEKRRVRLPERHLDRLGIDGLAGLIGADLRHAGLRLRRGVHDAIEAKLDRLGVERRPVVKRHPAAQPERPLAPILRDLPARRQPRMGPPLLVEFDQRFDHVLQDDEPGDVSGRGGIEAVRLEEHAGRQAPALVLRRPRRSRR